MKPLGATTRPGGPTSSIPGHPSRHECDACRAVRARYARIGSLNAAQGRGRLIPAIGTLRRVRALMAIGWTRPEIAAAAGETRESIMSLMGRGDDVTITVWRARRYAAVYDRLSMTPGTSKHARRVRTWARKGGYAPPLAWDDDTIDDPAAVPQGVAHWEEAA